MSISNTVIKHIEAMRTSIIENYGIPGISSSLIGGYGAGMVRLFDCSRDHQEEVAPHSHKFDFTCLVLSGTVRNRVWSRCKDGTGDEFMLCRLDYMGAIGRYKKVPIEPLRYSYEDEEYEEGEWYSMKHYEIHSIHFSRGCKVLFFEGPVIERTTSILEPYVNGEHVESFEVKPWMFKPQQGKGEG